MRSQTRAVARFENDPNYGADARQITRMSHEAEVAVVEVLAECRERRELEQAADEAERLADEIDEYGE